MRMKPLFRHLPPAAIPITGGDIRCALNAISDPGGSLARFRSALAERWSATQACYLVSSGRAALALTLMAARRLSERRRVILPAYSCPTVVQSIQTAGLEPVFCDVSPVTLDLERQALGWLSDPKPLAILPTHLYGLAVDIRDLLALGQAQGIYIIEDAAQAFGARVNGKMAGCLGEAGFYSLGRGKCLPAGHGGAITARGEFAAAIAETIDAHTPPQIKRGAGALVAFLMYGALTHPLGWWFVVRTPLNPASAGMNAAKLPPIRLDRMAAVPAGLGRSVLDRLDSAQAIARRNAAVMMERLAGYRFVSFIEPPRSAEPVFLRLPILVNGEERAKALFERLRRAGIGVSRSYYHTLPELFPELSTRANAYPGAERLAKCLLTLPTHPFMNEEDLGKISRAFQDVDRH